MMNSVATESPVKKPYVAPVLTVHGDLRTLTQAGSGGKNENGNCKSDNKTKCARP